MKRPYGAKPHNEMAPAPMKMADGGMAHGYADGGMVEGDGLHRQYPGFEAPNAPCHHQGPGVRSLQDYKK